MLLNAKKVAELKTKSEKQGGGSKSKYKVDLPQLLKVKSVEGEVKKDKNVLSVQFEHAKYPDKYPVVYKFYYVDHEIAMGQVVDLIVKGFEKEVKPARDIAELASQVKKFVGKELKVALRLKPSFYKKIDEETGEIKAFSLFNYDLWYVGNKNDENFSVDASKVVMLPDSYYNSKLNAFEEEYNDITIEHTDPQKYFSTYVEEQEEKEEESSSTIEESKDLLSQGTIDASTEEELDDDLPF